MCGAVAVLGVVAGLMDDAWSVGLAVPTGGASLTVVGDSWDHNGSSPSQPATGEAVRGVLDWSARPGW